MIPAQTPTGWRIVSQSTCRAIFASDWPMSRLGTPQANSTTSMPRWTEARASARVLPCSRVTRLASSSACSASRSRNRNITRARSTTGVSAQAGRADAAASHGPIDFLGRAERDRGDDAAVRRVVNRPERFDRLASQRPAISIFTVAGASGSAWVVAIGFAPWEGFQSASYSALRNESNLLPRERRARRPAPLGKHRKAPFGRFAGRSRLLQDHVLLCRLAVGGGSVPRSSDRRTEPAPTKPRIHAAAASL